MSKGIVMVGGGEEWGCSTVPRSERCSSKQNKTINKSNKKNGITFGATLLEPEIYSWIYDFVREI